MGVHARPYLTLSHCRSVIEPNKETLFEITERANKSRCAEMKPLQWEKPKWPHYIEKTVFFIQFLMDNKHPISGYETTLGY